MEVIFVLPKKASEMEALGFKIVGKFRPEGWAGDRSSKTALVMIKEEIEEEEEGEYDCRAI